jgi:hypothetical protein
MPARVITQVTLENFHELVPEYIFNNKLMIQNYEDTKEIYLSMLKDGYLFTFDRDILITCLTDLTYMYAPGDDVNKDAVVELLVLDSELEEEDEDEDEEDDSVNRTINFPPGVDSSLEPREQADCPDGM